MPDTGEMQFNKLNYDGVRKVVEFALRKNLADGVLVISGEVPLPILSSPDARSPAQAAVRQALLDAVEALDNNDEHKLEQ